MNSNFQTDVTQLESETLNNQETFDGIDEILAGLLIAQGELGKKEKTLQEKDSEISNLRQELLSLNIKT